ncbi:MAG: TIGR02217 family protein [Rhizobiaceae bacterium]
MADLTGFHDVRFPLGVSFGATGGPEWRNEIVGLISGREKRNARFAHSRRRYDAGTGVKSLDDVHQVTAFFEGRRGSLHAFRFRDPFDYKSCLASAVHSATDQPIGTGDGINRRFPLAKRYGSGAQSYDRPIQMPVAATIKVAVNGTSVPVTDYEFDFVTSEIVFDLGFAPPSGAAVTAGYEFDVPVRFDMEQLSISLAAFTAGQIPSIPLIEVSL